MNDMDNLQSQLNQLIQSYSNLNQLQSQRPIQDDSIYAPEIQWISGGIKGAMSIKMRPNTQTALFDRDGAVFYLRTVDANGVELPMKIGRFTLEDPPEPENNVLTRKDLDDFKNEIRQMLMMNQNNQNGQFNSAQEG